VTTATDVDAHLAEIEEQGYTILPGVIDDEALDALDADLRRLERDLAITAAGNDFEGTRTVRIYNLLVHGPLYEAIPVHPAVLPVVEGVLDHGCLVSSLWGTASTSASSATSTSPTPSSCSAHRPSTT
jgi:ectoine hydroxylase-related dioxygenase (phytanoyl-CoA dioxygenase family)